MNYQEAAAYILDIPKFTSKNNPEHTKEFLHRLGDPQARMQVIHVAGTNGKGSVCVYVDAMLRAQGRRTGLFTSPHLVKMNERIVIDGTMISDRLFVEIFETVRQTAERMVEEGLPHPTFFEFLFGMAVSAFAGAGVEYAVLETGLGGRLDATNCVAHPVCSVITSIGYDHMSLLGDTLEQIAGEKAGILKAGTPAIFAESGEESDRVLERRALELGITWKKVGKNDFEILGIQNKHIAFSCTNAYYGGVTWKLHNTGIYQPENACLALEVMRLLFGEQGRVGAWKEALEQIVWQGRMEEVLPDIYIDGAHNLSAVERFSESVAAEEEPRGRIVLFSAVQDKDYEQMIACLCGRVDAEMYVVTQISDKRAEEAGRLAEIFRACTDRPVIEIAEPEAAWKYLLENQKGRRVYCLGSLYLAGMVRRLKEETHAGLRRGTEEVQAQSGS